MLLMNDFFEHEILECLINLKIKKVDFKSHNIQNGPKRHQQMISHRKKKWPKWHKTAIPPNDQNSRKHQKNLKYGIRPRMRARTFSQFEYFGLYFQMNVEMIFSMFE